MHTGRRQCESKARETLSRKLRSSRRRSSSSRRRRRRRSHGSSRSSWTGFSPSASSAKAKPMAILRGGSATELSATCKHIAASEWRYETCGTLNMHDMKRSAGGNHAIVSGKQQFATGNWGRRRHSPIVRAPRSPRG